MLQMALVVSLLLGIERQKCCSCCPERTAAGGIHTSKGQSHCYEEYDWGKRRGQPFRHRDAEN